MFPDSLAKRRDRFTSKYFTVARVETGFRVLLAITALVPVAIALAILFILIFESINFFSRVSIFNFLLNTKWDAILGGENYGIWVLLSASLLVTAIAMLVAIPLGVISAIYLSEYAHRSVRPVLRSIVQSLAGIPTVVLGYFAFLVVTPFLERFLPSIAPFNGLSAGLVVGFMVVPVISSISAEAIAAVPLSLREGAYALGFTRLEVILRVVLPVALPAIVAAVSLAGSRAFGETMIAAIAGGQVPTVALDPLAPISTIPAYILQVSSLGLSLSTIEGDDLITYLTIFPVALVLLTVTLGLNTVGHWLSRRYFLTISNSTIVSQFQPMAVDNFCSIPQTGSFLPKTRRRSLFDRVAQMVGVGAIGLLLFVAGILAWNALKDGWVRLNWQFLTNFGSNNPLEAGIYAALAGTTWLLVTSLALVFPIGLGAAIFLEEYLPDSQIKYWLEIQIANLAALPTIIYGLLGLELFVRFCQPLTGGRTILSGSLTLAVILLPVAILTVRSALKNVAQDQRQAAYASGMSQWQVICYVVLPQAMADILEGLTLTSTIAIGETAAIIAIVGSLGVIPFAPELSWQGLRSEFINLPTQIYLWATRPELEFQVNGAAATIVLIIMLLMVSLIISAIANYLRRYS
jgi:phosphate transport system permease protein